MGGCIFFRNTEAGCTVVPLSPLFKEYELEFYLTDSNAKAIVVEDSLYERASKTGIELIDISDFKPGLFEPEKNGDPKEDLAIIPYTAGTTGEPKGVMLTHYNSVSNAIQFAAASEIHENDISLITLPLYHSYAMNMLMLGGVWAGLSFVILPRFNVEEFCELVEKYGVTVIGTTAAMIIYLTDWLEKSQAYDFISWRLAIIGAAPVPPDVMIRIKKVLSEKCNNNLLIFQHGWRLTEASPCVALNPFYANKPETQGIALSDVRQRL